MTHVGQPDDRLHNGQRL